ncbi:MAG: hypothetical protein CL685_02830 [Candidatus Magasanikbacteria bacterium]|nr:hypothetical protein [Candidatus Magasanikbacteria bacterium]
MSQRPSFWIVIPSAETEEGSLLEYAKKRHTVTSTLKLPFFLQPTESQYSELLPHARCCLHLHMRIFIHEDAVTATINPRKSYITTSQGEKKKLTELPNNSDWILTISKRRKAGRGVVKKSQNHHSTTTIDRQISGILST